MKIKVVLASLVVILFASIARADDPRMLRARITSNNRYVAYVCARFELEGKAYIAQQGLPVDVGPTVLPLAKESTLGVSLLWIENGSDASPGLTINNLGKGSVILRDGASGSIDTNPDVIEQTTVSYRVELHPGPVPGFHKWLVTISVGTNAARNVIIARRS